MADTQAAGISVEIRPEGLDEIKRRLRAVQTLVHKPSPLMKAIGRALESSAKRRFRAGVAPDGTPWKPSLRARTGGGKTMILSGHLRDSISSDGDDERATIGSNLIYARIHQLGGVITAKNGQALRFFMPGVGWRFVRRVVIPARPYLGVSADDRIEIADQVRDFLLRAAA